MMYTYQFCLVLSLRGVLFSFIIGYISVHDHANWNITGNSCLCCRGLFATLTVGHNFFFNLTLRELKELIWNAVPYFWECENFKVLKALLKVSVLKILLIYPEENLQGWRCSLGVLFALSISWRCITLLQCPNSSKWYILNCNGISHGHTRN